MEQSQTYGAFRCDRCIKNDLLSASILFIYAIYPQPIKACWLIIAIMEQQEIPK